MHVDDIEAAFRRVLYHPDLAAVFASVFMEFLVIPVGMIFGSRSSPSFYCILSELRSHVASVASLDDVPVPEEWQVSLPPELSAAESRSLTKVGEDPLYKDASPSDGPLLQSAFVDDNGKAELRRRILEAIRNSVAAAFLVFGSPDDDWRGACFAVDKWLSEALHEVVYLGFLVNTRTMTVSWPVDKRQEFATLINSVLPSSTKDRRKRQPLDFARILGHVRNPALIVPSLSYVSLRLQFWFNDAIRRSKGASRNSSWWRRNQLQVPNFVWKDLRLLLADRRWLPMAQLVQEHTDAAMVSVLCAQGNLEFVCSFALSAARFPRPYDWQVWIVKSQLGNAFASPLSPILLDATAVFEILHRLASRQRRQVD